MEKYYLAYGANMNHKKMFSRCLDPNRPDYHPKPVGRCYIPDFELMFYGKANINPKKGAKTPAFVWEITERDEIQLDLVEGRYPGTVHYNKTMLEVTLENGRKVSGIAYTMVLPDKADYELRYTGTLEPTTDYKKCILKGYKDCGFLPVDFVLRVGKVPVKKK